MKPIQEILNRVKWDTEFGNAEFVLGYLDRFQPDLVLVPLPSAGFDENNEESFELTDEEGSRVNIPLHRVKKIFRNGELIWSRNY